MAGVVKCLREARIPVRHIRRHAELTFTGDEANPERVVPLCEYRTNVVAQYGRAGTQLGDADWKLAYYAYTFGVTARETTA